MNYELSKAQIKLVRGLQQKKQRDEQRLFVAEGRKCVEEIAKGFEQVFLFVEGENASAEDIARMSSLRTPQGVIGVFRMPDAAPTGTETEGLTVALDGVQDPGNMGTIIRTCDWFGVRDVVCSEDTVDCFNPKVVQATMGALARVRVHYTDLSHWLTDVSEKGVPVYGTLLDGKNMYAEGGIQERHRGVIVMGNEGNGISQAVRKCITHPLFIPPYLTGAETSESLNVGIATAVVLAEFRRVNN